MLAEAFLEGCDGSITARSIICLYGHQSGVCGSSPLDQLTWDMGRLVSVSSSGSLGHSWELQSLE